MGKLFRIELKKLGKSKAMRVMLIVAAALSVLNVVVYGLMDAIEDLMSLVFGEMSGYTIAMSLASDSSDIMLMVVILMAVLVGGDFSARTLQAQVAAGFGRFQIILSRFLSSALAYVILYVLYFGVTVIGVTAIFGFGDDITSKMMEELFLNIFLSFIMAMTMLALYMLFAFLFKTTGATIGVSLPMMLMGTSIIQMFTFISELADDIISFTPFGQQLLLSSLLPHSSELEPVKFIGVCVVWMAAFIALTFASFRKAELK